MICGGINLFRVIFDFQDVLWYYLQVEVVMKTIPHTFILFTVILSAFAVESFAANPQVTLHIDGAVTGDIVLELYPDKAPVTVANFLNYTRTGFYDGLIFHRVIDDFMIQGGGYDPDMVKKTPGDAIINESTNGLSNLTGTVAMARTPQPHSATSEFFINEVDNLFLDFANTTAYDNDNNAYYMVGYCVFGKVINGMSVVHAIAALETDSNDKPLENVIIESAVVTLESPYCSEKLKGDVDADCDVDAVDLMKLSIQWQNPQCQGCYSADTSGDGEVDFADFAELAANWLSCNSITTPCD